MGTIAFHMVLIILLLGFKLNTKREFLETEIVIEIPKDIVDEIEKEEAKKEDLKKEEKAQPTQKESVEELLKSMAVNKSVKSTNKNTPRESVEKMIAEIQKDLDRGDNGSTTSDIDEGFVQDSLNMLQDKEKQRLLDSLQSIVYNGPSSVYYKLEGRHKIYLPIPVYKCEGEGLVVVEILVNPSGRVIQARILKKESAVEDDCLFDAALVGARKTRFNVDAKSPSRQKGTISYNFVKQ